MYLTRKNFKNCILVVQLIHFFGVNSELLYKWKKVDIFPRKAESEKGGEENVNWRITSFALTNNKIYFSLIGTNLEGSGNGLVGECDISSSPSPTVRVFPLEEIYKMHNSEKGKIKSPICVRTDDCNRLWVLDSAVENVGGLQRKTEPGIFVFDIRHGRLLRNFPIPKPQWSSSSFFVNFIVDVVCGVTDFENSFGYVADFNRFHLLVYDFHQNRSELKSHPFFSPNPLIWTPNEVLFNSRHQDLNGIYGLTLDNRPFPNTSKHLYFHPLAGTHEFRINTLALKSHVKLRYEDVEVFKNKGENTESGISVFDPVSNSIFFAEINTKKIGVLRLDEWGRANESKYYRFDVNLTNGFISDLSIRQSELWLLLNAGTYIAIHKFSLSQIILETFPEKINTFVLNSCASSTLCTLHYGILTLAITLLRFK